MHYLFHSHKGYGEWTVKEYGYKGSAPLSITPSQASIAGSKYDSIGRRRKDGDAVVERRECHAVVTPIILTYEPQIDTLTEILNAPPGY